MSKEKAAKTRQHPCGSSRSYQNLYIHMVAWIPAERKSFINKEMEKIYSEALENQPMASETVRESYKKLDYALDEYISALQEDIFAWAYELGRKAGAGNEEY